MDLKINKITDKLDLDVEAQWNCNSSTQCYVIHYTDSNPQAPIVVGGGAISYCPCSSRTVGSYTTEGWSIF